MCIRVHAERYVPLSKSRFSEHESLIKNFLLIPKRSTNMKCSGEETIISDIFVPAHIYPKAEWFQSR